MPQRIATANWSTRLPDTHQRIGISRGVPRWAPAGFKLYRALQPGNWFKTVTPDRYAELYGEILSRLDPKRVTDDLLGLAQGRVATLLCYESPRDIAAGVRFCHRHMVADWLERHLPGVVVEEVGHPGLDRWAQYRANGLRAPSFGPAKPVMPHDLLSAG